MPVGTVASVKGYIKGLKEDINQILFWETPIIYIYAHNGDPGESRWFA
jgi:hypothetical protein